MHKWASVLFLLSVTMIANAEPSSGNPGTIPTSGLLTILPVSIARPSNEPSTALHMSEQKKRRPACRGCLRWFHAYPVLPRLVRYEQRRPRYEGSSHTRHARSKFGPIIRRDACAPKVYVQSPENDGFKAYCGSSELFASEAANNE
jgi:hypothetical protein